ncbi:hypothetical protein R1sor_007261 [Riccia sorocarpa]|uniref:DNA mismatch repair protein MLH3 n=1 Tax=Riccia sorocarpa TaxID=122646 RepID=A0ABD3HTL0_9MARC
MRQISRLSNSVVSRLRSGTIISDIAQIAEELVCNSIDAGATQIQTEVDVEACFLKVEDDGCGISRNDLTLVGERHATSKLRELEELEGGVKTLGFRGEALSSLSDIALVEITSRCRGTANTYRKIVKNCATVSIGLCSQQRPPGTTVTVRDMFYNQPVRRRLMIASHRKVLSSLKERVLRFILIHPSISFKVTDLARSEVCMLSKSSTSLGATVSGMFGKDLLRSLEKIDFRQGSIRIAGYLSRSYHCFPSKNVQFIYINRRFVSKTPIHRLLNKWGQLNKNCLDDMLATSKRRVRNAEGEAGKQNGSSGRSLLPVFVLNLICPLSDYDITLEASKTMVEFKDWSPILNLVQGILQSLWGTSAGPPRQDLIISSRKSGDISRKADFGHGVQHSRRSSSRPRDSVSSARVSVERADPLMPLGESESTDNILAERSSKGNNHAIPRLPWIVESCGVEKTPLRSVLSFDKSDLSLPDFQTPESSSASDCFENVRLDLSPMKSSSGRLVERIRSLEDTQGSAAEAYTVSTLGKNIFEQSLDLSVGLPKVRMAQRLIAFDDIELDKLQPPPLEVSDFSVGPFWSGSDHSYRDRSSPDSSCFLKEVRSFVPERLTWREDGSDEKERGVKDKLRISDKPFASNETFGAYDISVDQFAFMGESFALDDGCFVSSSINSEASDAHQLSVNAERQAYSSKRSVCRFMSKDDGSSTQKTLHQGESYTASNLSRLRVKRNLEMFFSGQDKNVERSPVERHDPCRVGLGSKRQRRSSSGPPFYHPPKRCGSHGNPPNSLSSLQKESAGVLPKRDNCKTKIAVVKHNNPEPALKQTACSKEQSPDLLSSRKGWESEANNRAEAAHEVEGCPSHLRGQVDTSAVVPAHLGLPDVTGCGDSGAAPPDHVVQDMLKEWSNPCMKNDGGVLNLSSGILCWNSMSFLPDSIVKERLQHARVLQQVDKKFIPAVADGVLIIIDQHAADERVRLEELREQVLGSSQSKEGAQLSSPLDLTVAFTETQILQTYREQIESWGWRFRLSARHSTNSTWDVVSVVGSCKVSLSAVPCILGVMLSGEDLIEYLRQLTDTQGSSAPPPAVIRVLNYKACRGAIMFGDVLLPAESRQLVEHLKETSLCFQCAHGRPTMAPLVDLRALHKRLQTSDSSSGNLAKSVLPSGSTTVKPDSPVSVWHGLQHRKSSLQRSLERLKRAKQ